MKKFSFRIFKSIKFQLYLGYVTILLTAMLATGLYQYQWFKTHQYDAAKSLLHSRLSNAEKIELISLETLSGTTEQEEALLLKMMDLEVSVTLLDAQGQVLLDSELGLRHEYAKNLLLKKQGHNPVQLAPPNLGAAYYQDFVQRSPELESFEITKNAADQAYLILLTKVGPMPNFSGALQLSMPLEEIDQSIASYFLSSFKVASMVFALGLLALWVLLAAILKSLRVMTHHLRSKSESPVGLKLPAYPYQTEIDAIATAFNTLSDELKMSFDHEREARERIKRFVADAAHELRTPLTSIRGFAEVIALGDFRAGEKLSLGLDRIISESDRLSRLVDQLLGLTRLDQDTGLIAEALSLKVLVADLLPQLAVVQGHRKVEMALSDEGLVMANQDQMHQVIWNLFQNACAYTHEERGQIKISLESLEATPRDRQGPVALVKLSIEDNGIGIPLDQQDKIFDRFYRLEDHRSRAQGGSGLGLAIVQGIVLAHGGWVEVFSTPGEGSVFSVFLPQYQP